MDDITPRMLAALSKMWVMSS